MAANVGSVYCQPLFELCDTAAPPEVIPRPPNHLIRATKSAVVHIAARLYGDSRNLNSFTASLLLQ
jgi:hypothetical protein